MISGPGSMLCMVKGQFHQHFTRTFLPISLTQKITKTKCNREKLRGALSHEKSTPKMLIKSSPGGQFNQHVCTQQLLCLETICSFYFTNIDDAQPRAHNIQQEPIL